MISVRRWTIVDVRSTAPESMDRFPESLSARLRSRNPIPLVAYCYILFSAALLFFISCGSRMDRQPVLTQISTMDALISGGYDPVVPIQDLHRYGDFGIGTYERLDGEMVMINDTLFQILLDGTARTAALPDSTPFADIVGFQPDTALVPESNASLDSLKNLLDRILSARGVPCAVRITGSFENVRTRSVPPQAKPYPPLSEVVASRQKITDTAASTGDAVGYWFPPYMKNINVPGFHMHFISGDRKIGGHLFDCVLAGGRVELQTIEQFHMIISSSAAHPSGADTDRLKNALERAE